MGISGLLPLLKEVQVTRHVSDFKGQSLAVDGYVWLHKGAFGCAEELVTSPGCTKYVDYAMHRVRLLRHHGVTPFLVFDGGPLPAKRGTEDDRAAKRSSSLARAQSLTAQGRHKEARDHYTKCVDITPEMALQLIKALKAEQVPYIVAPYEADAQLAYLEREGIVDGIITEDSDLLVFGCRNVIYKMDGDGMCIHMVRDHFSLCKEFSFAGWGVTEFRRMAILAGCDYLGSIPGIGIKTAHRLLRKHKSIEKVVQNIRLDGALTVPSDYIPQFRLAELVFLHQRVYDPRARRLTTLFPVMEDKRLAEVEDMYIGPDMDPEMAQGIAEGRVHPETKQVLDDISPLYNPEVTPPLKFSTEKVSTSFYTDKGKVLGPSQKTNVTGPLDAFIKRLPPKNATAERPFIPAPVGTRASGPARLSDMSVSKANAVKAAEEQAVKDENDPYSTSKYFAKTSVGIQAEKEILKDLVFDFGDNQDEKVKEDDVALTSPPQHLDQLDDRESLPELSSPSAACSTLQSPRPVSQEDFPHFSSPGQLTDAEGPILTSPVRLQDSDSARRRVRKRPSDVDTPIPLESSPISKKRKPDNIDCDTISSPPVSLAPASPPPRIDFRQACGVDDVSDVCVELQMKENIDVFLEEEGISKARAQAVAKGLSSKYAFVAKVSAAVHI